MSTEKGLTNNEIAAKIEDEVANLEEGVTPLDLLKHKMNNEYAIRAMYRIEVATDDKFMGLFDKLLNYITGKVKTVEPTTGITDDGTVKVDYGDTSEDRG